MQTASSLGMAYHIKKLFHVKLEKKGDENWGNYNKYNKRRRVCFLILLLI